MQKLKLIKDNQTLRSKTYEKAKEKGSKSWRKKNIHIKEQAIEKLSKIFSKSIQKNIKKQASKPIKQLYKTYKKPYKQLQTK